MILFKIMDMHEKKHLTLKVLLYLCVVAYFFDFVLLTIQS